VSNVLFDALLAAPLHHRQKTVCFAILRLTLGFGGQPLRAFSLELLARWTQIPARKLRELLAELQAQGIVIRRDGGTGRRAAWGIAPDPRTWQIPLPTATPAPGGQGCEAVLPLPLAGRGFAEPLPLAGRGPLPLAGSPGKETLKEERTQNDGAAAVVAREVAALSEEDLIAAAAPGFAAYGKVIERWGPARRRKLRDRADELARSGLARERILRRVAAAPHGFVWFHRDARPGQFDPRKLLTPDTVYDEGFDRYVEAFLEARRAGQREPFTTRQILPRRPAPAAPAPGQGETAPAAPPTTRRERVA
jgi:hypothetical protein